MAHAISTFLAFASDDADLATLKSFAESRGLAVDNIHKGTIDTATLYLKTHPSPDVLLVELPSQSQAPAMLEALAEVCDPNTKVITIGKVNEYSFYCWLMDIGITQYLLSPLAVETLESTFVKLQGGVDAAKEKSPCIMVAVMGARGGVGATTVAINLAGIIAEETHKKVALVDLDPQEGTVALALDIEPSVGLRDALEKPDRIDALFLERVMGKVGKYLSVLSAEESLAEQLVVNEKAAIPLLAELRNKYDYVVLDVPRHLNDFTRACLGLADHNVLVTDLTLLSLRDTLRMQDAMREAWKNRAPHIVANRVGFAAKQEIPALDFEKGANAKITAQLSFAPELFMPLSRDIASVKHKANPLTKPLYQLAGFILPAAKQVDVAAKKPAIKFSLFKKKGD